MKNQKWMWLSFVTDDDEKDAFLGACIVKGDDIIEAAREAHLRGCNPGGEVAGWFVDPQLFDDEDKNVLLSKKVCIEKYGGKRLGDLDKGMN